MWQFKWQLDEMIGMKVNRKEEVGWRNRDNDGK